MASCPPPAARCSAVSSLVFLALTSVLWSKRSRVMGSFQFGAAQCSDVPPSVFLAAMSAPRSSSSWAMALCPLLTARCSVVEQQPGGGLVLSHYRKVQQRSTVRISDRDVGSAVE